MSENNLGFRPHDKEFERILKEYRKVINVIRLRMITKYGNRARRWFPNE